MDADRRVWTEQFAASGKRQADMNGRLITGEGTGMSKLELNIEALDRNDEGDVEKLTAALDTHAADDQPALWTEQFAASGKIGKG